HLVQTASSKSSGGLPGPAHAWHTNPSTGPSPAPWHEPVPHPADHTAHPPASFLFRSASTRGPPITHSLIIPGPTVSPRWSQPWAYKTYREPDPPRLPKSLDFVAKHFYYTGVAYIGDDRRRTNSWQFR